MTLYWLCGLLLAVVLLVPGAGAASLFCDERSAQLLAAGDIPEAEWSPRGFFVDPARPTRVFLRIRPHESGSYHQCFLQHEDGPLSQMRAENIEFLTLCRDPVSGRDHAVFSRYGTGSGSIPALQYWSVHPDTQQLALEYRQNIPELQEHAHLLVDAEGQCQWRQQKAARAVFDDAMAVLRDEIELDDRVLDIAVGDSLPLPTRPLSAETVRHWLHALRIQAAAFATIETLDLSESAPGQPWRLVQILGRELCRAPGVVLLHDTRSGQWHALYAVPSGCARALNFPLRDMMLSGDTLVASACTACSFWGAYGTFAIDLRTHRITRVEPAADEARLPRPLADPEAAQVNRGGRGGLMLDGSP